VQEQQRNVAHLAARAQVEPEAVQLAQLQWVRLLTQAGRAADAVALARQAVAFFDARYPQPTRYTEAARWYLADALLAQGQREEGIRHLQASLNRADHMGQGNNPLERAHKQLGLALVLRTTEPVRAVSLATDACAVLAKSLGGPNPRTLKCHAVRAWLQASAAPASHREAARAAFWQARDALLPTLPPAHLLRVELLAAQGELLALEPASPAESRLLLTRAQAQYRSALGSALPQPLLNLH
jgi:hypothetical protein